MSRKDQPVDPETHEVRVCSERCDSCIFWTDGRSVVPPAEAQEVIGQNLAADALLSCHDTLYRDDFIPAVCAGFWAKHRNDVLAGRYAQMFLGTIRVSPPPKE